MQKKSYDERELEITAAALRTAIERFGLTTVIGELFDTEGITSKGIDVEIPISESIRHTIISDLVMGEKELNSMKQYTLKTKQEEIVENILPLIQKFDNVKVKGIGKSRLLRIKTVILQMCWDDLNDEQKDRFCYDLLRRNCY